MSVNKAILLGRITRDVEIRQTNSGKSVASTSLATNEKYKDKQGNKKENTEFHNLIFWNQAEVAHQYLKKGDQVYIEGKIKTRSWDTDNGKRYTTEIYVERFVMLGSRQQGQRQQQNYSAPAAPPAPPSQPQVVNPTNDGLPF